MDFLIRLIKKKLSLRSKTPKKGKVVLSQERVMPMNPYHKALYAKDKGRRVIHDNANYKSWDFLKQNTIESPHVSP